MELTSLLASPMAIRVVIVLFILFIIKKLVMMFLQPKSPNPFAKDSRVPRKPYIHDQHKRDKVLKQGFSQAKVPENLDAIVIGSGIGGLTTAAVMAKAGKKVLVLEQHDQAGGCCHTFLEKGYEWDVGIHYVGEMGSQTLNKTLTDQITDGQLEWSALDDDFDVVSIGYGEEQRIYPTATGVENWQNLMKKQFPNDTEAIDKYFELVNSCTNTFILHGVLKLVPLWLVNIAVRSGILKLFTNLYSVPFTTLTLDVVKGLTDNEDLQVVFMYGWGDYGTLPSKSYFAMQALLCDHFMKDGSHYPKGGASEIPFNIIPVIEKAGGRVFVRVNVEKILTSQNKAIGVRVKKGTETTDIMAPIIISNAGLYNTFRTLLPQETATKSRYLDIANELKPAVGAMNVFLGLNCSAEELGVKKQNMWAYPDTDIDGIASKYFNSTSEEAMDSDVPLLFISFPSAKDPEWDNHPGRKDKSTVAIITLANWEWFQEWQDCQVKRRGDDYDEVKNTIGHAMIERTCQLYPQIRDKIDHIEIATPVTNKYYIAAPHGELYGLDHTLERFQPWMVAKLRPETDIQGLYLTGQDILEGGFTGALFGGVIAAQAILGRDVMGDLETLHNKIVSGDKAKAE